MLPTWNRYPGRTVFALTAFALLVYVAEHVNGRFWLNDLQVYLGASRSLLRGEQLYGIAHGLDSGVFKYAPFMAVLFVPLALLPQEAAASLHFIGITAAFIGALHLADRLLRDHLLNRRPGTYGPLLITALVVIVHAHRELHLGNINVLLLWVLLVALDSLLRGRAVLGGVLIGLAVIAKPHFLVLLPLLIMRRHSRATLFALGTVAFCLLLPTVFLGMPENASLHGAWLEQMALHNSSLIHVAGDDHQAVNTVYSFLHRAVLGRFLAGPSSMEAYVVLGIIAAAFGALVLAHQRREENPGGSFLFEYLLLIALVPSITLTDTEHFLLSIPLVLWLAHHLLPHARPFWLPYAALPVLLAYGGNWEDALGPLSDRMVHYGVLGISNLGLMALGLFLFHRRGHDLRTSAPPSPA